MVGKPFRLSLPRRTFMMGAAATLFQGRDARAADMRVASMSWAVSEMLYAMGVTPIAAAETLGYDAVIGEPATPRQTVDIGLQGTPNIEYLARLAPDLIIIQSWQSGLRAALERCGRVESLDIYTGRGDIYANACAAAHRLGDLIGEKRKADELVLASDARLAGLGRSLQQVAMPGICLVQMIDGNNLTAFTAGSLFDGAFTRLGLRNAWREPPSLLWGGSLIGLEQLADTGDALLVLMASPGLAPDETMTKSPLWQALPAVRSGRFLRLPSFWGFGALPTAVRFANALTKALLERQNG
jgi:ferric hydroxamate transport system substrate-binding protein